MSDYVRRMSENKKQNKGNMSNGKIDEVKQLVLAQLDIRIKINEIAQNRIVVCNTRARNSKLCIFSYTSCRLTFALCPPWRANIIHLHSVSHALQALHIASADIGHPL